MIGIRGLFMETFAAQLFLILFVVFGDTAAFSEDQKTLSLTQELGLLNLTLKSRVCPSLCPSDALPKVPAAECGDNEGGKKCGEGDHLDPVCNANWNACYKLVIEYNNTARREYNKFMNRCRCGSACNNACKKETE
jgi:hypothetical protein